MISHPRLGRFGRQTYTAGALVTTAMLCLGASVPGTSALASGLMGLRAAVHAAAPTPQASVAKVTGVHREDGPDSTKLTFDLSAPIEPTAFVLADPDRVIVDLPQVDFDMPSDAGNAPARPRGGRKTPLVAAFRFGLLEAGRSRIVVDLAEPVRIVGASVQKSAGRNVLVVELARTDRAAFLVAAHRRTLAALAAPDAPGPAPTEGKPTIVLDAGHGGPDTGAIVNGIVEKEVALAFARSLATKLEATGSFNVVMTRSSDVFIPLSERVQIARGANAALMVSIHADTLPETSDVSGATVYTVSDKASDAYAAKVAAKENDADAAGGVQGTADTADVNDILFDLTRQETRAYSHVFARTLVNYWKIAGRLNKNPQRSAGFVVLKAPDVPSVLVELGYLSSPADSAQLTSDDWRDKATSRMAEAIEAYFADHHGIAKAAAGVPMPLRQATAEIAAPQK